MASYANPKGDFDMSQRCLRRGSMAEQKNCQKTYVGPEKVAYGILWLTLGDTLMCISGICSVAVWPSTKIVEKLQQ